MTDHTPAPLFPAGFLIGASTAPHQVEGDNVHSDWWAFEQMPETPISETSGRACDSLHRWRDDIDVLADAGMTAYRFGVEWARIEPEEDRIDPSAVDHYRRMVDYAASRGLEPVLTLHHFTSPAWFTRSGGWAREDAVERFRRYVEAIDPVIQTSIDSGGGRVVTINEPNMLAIMTRVISGEVSLDTGLGGALPEPDPSTREVLVEAHRSVRADLRERHAGVRVGWSVANQCVQSRAGGQQRAGQYRELVEDVFLRAGREDDFIGVQAYTRTVFDADGVVDPAPGRPRTLTGWEDYPQALEHAVRHTAEVAGVPILVTENGIATDDDDRRISYTAAALRGLRRAVADGVRVEGYLHWSLLDNYEWGSWGPTFGLVAVDRESGSFTRRPKPSLAWLGSAAAATSRAGVVPAVDPGALTREQQASLTSGANTWDTEVAPGISRVTMSDGPHGLRRQIAGADAFGINASVPATCFPPACALASSWDDDLIARVASHLGREARALGVQALLGPGVNIKRSPLGGRNFEYASEDPLVSGRYGEAFVRGVQSRGVAAVPKHFAVNNQETDRFRVSAQVDERALREIYLPAFERVVSGAGPWMLMSAYNRVNGVFASENHRLLTELLRNEWGFDGVVVSDWGAVDDRVAALNAGLDLEMPPSGTDSQIIDAADQGRVSDARLAEVALRAGRLAERTALPGSPAESLPEQVVSDGDALAVDAARESAVLLQNDGTLPLQMDRTGRVAVLGVFAEEPRYQGGGSSHVVPSRLHCALPELRERLGTDHVDYAPGFSIDGSHTSDLADEALATAAAADVAVVFVGLPDGAESEGSDRTSMRLPKVQISLLERLTEIDVPVVVVISSGGIVELGGWREKTAAIFQGSLLGQGGGAAIVDLLLGDVSPSARLTETIPLALADTPSHASFPGRDGQVVYGESIYVGYRHYDTFDVPVAFPFGHGLTYADVEYSALNVHATGGGAYDITFQITNTGTRSVVEVPQLYVATDEAGRPRHELRAYTRVEVGPRQSRTVSLTLCSRDFALWNVRERRWSVTPGEYTIQVGASSRDIRLTSVVSHPGDGYVGRLNGQSTIGEWLEHPVGAKVIAPLVAGVTSRTGEEPAPELVAMFRQMPLGKLTAWGIGFGQDDLEKMVEAVDAARLGGPDRA